MSAILEAVRAGLPIEDLYDRVLAPFLEWVGEQWQQGRAAVWEEHLMAAAVGVAVDALHPQVMAHKRDVPAVPLTVAFFCPPEENHDLGLRMLAHRFDLRGFRTVYVGAMTPYSQMIACAKEMGARVICLSASTHFQRAALRAGVEQLRAALPGVRIVVGGPAFARSAEGWQDHLATSLDALFEELRQAASASDTADDDRVSPDA